MSSATFHNWKAKFGRIDISDARRLKILETENARLKKHLTDSMLDNSDLERLARKELTTPWRKREATLTAMSKYDSSRRQACKLANVDPMTVRRERRSDNPHIRERPRDVVSKPRRSDYRRIELMLACESIIMNPKKLRRLYREEHLAAKRRRGRKRTTNTRTSMPIPDGPCARWSLDIAADTFGEARCFRILALIDDFTRECLALVAVTSISRQHVAR